MVGSRVEVEITGVAHGGIFVARHEGRVVFVADAMLGERVVAEVTDDRKKSFWRADTLEVLDAAPSRRPHVWPEASLDRMPGKRAGGAEFGHIELGAQRGLKASVVREALKRMAGLEVDVEVQAVAADGSRGAGDETVAGTGWRTRTRLQVAPDGTPGPYAARSHEVIRVSDLPLAVPTLRTIAPLDEKFPGAVWVDLISPSVGNPFVMVGDPSSPPRRQRIIERVGDREFALDLHGFWQVHQQSPVTLTRAVQSAVDESLFDESAPNLDLYGGVGLLAAAIGDRFGPGVHIETVESDRRATDFAAENLADWRGASAVNARVDRYLATLANDTSARGRERARRATVVLDPPRSGAGGAVVESLIAMNPAQIVYVACDPVALARDVAMFVARGWRMAGLLAFDLFPNTHHIEAVATLTPPDSAPSRLS